jgi:hypothetical protein
MPNSSFSPTSSPEATTVNTSLSQSSAAELAQALLEKLAISDRDWHRLKSDRNVRANEQAAAAIVFLLKDQPEEALPRLQQAVAWLDRSISAPPCQAHGDRAKKEG